MSGERVGFRFKHADAVVKRNPQGRSRRGWVIEPVEQTTSRGTKMPAYKIRWRDSERPETVLQHMLIADPDPSPPPSSVSLDYGLLNHIKRNTLNNMLPSMLMK